MLTPFGKFIRKLRVDRNELLRDMAEKLHVTAAYLSAVETGKRNVPKDWVDEIVNLYNISKEDARVLYQNYMQSVTQVKIDLSKKSPLHREAVMVFAREFDELDDDDIKRFLEGLKGRRGEQ